MDIRKALIDRSSNERLWYAHDHVFSVGDILSKLKSISAELSEFTGKRVAILPGSNLDLAWQLACLDGIAESILLLPSEQPESVLREQIEAANCDRIVGKPVFRLLPTGFVPLLKDVDASSRLFERIPEGRIPLKTTWLIPTSGTTGTPKLVAHDLASLTRTAKRDSGRGSQITWGLLYELGRFAGLQVFFQALIGGSGLVFTESHESLFERVAILAAGGCNALSATPSLWRKILMLPSLEGLSLEWITLGGEIADQQVLSALSTRFPNARITHVYASTEAGVGFSVRDGMEGFPIDYVKTPQGDVSIKVDDEGRLLLRCDTSKQEYLDHFSPLRSIDGWVDTGDLVGISADGERYVFKGRASGAINVGGSKVHPVEIERVIQEVPGVRMVSVGARRNPIMGNVVEANIVPEPGADTGSIRQEIKAYCGSRLERYQQPAIIRFVESLELTQTGKVKRPKEESV